MTVKNAEDRVVKTVCSMCYSGCGVLAHVRNGRVVKIEGDRDHPVNRGQLCVKGLAGIELLYHPARLNEPLKRAGKRGEGRWQRISWDEALAAIAGKLTAIVQEQGPEAICLSRGSGLYYNAILGYFAYLLGTPNVMASGYICFQPAGTAVKATIGYPQPIQATEVVGDEPLNSACILLWAANPRHSYPYPLGEGIPRAQKGGAKLIVVDPRPTQYAREADLWLQLRPATDDALALGMIHVIVNEGLTDETFVSEWTHGFAELKAHVQAYPPQKVSEITWVPAEKIVAAARLFARTKPSCVCQRVPIDHSCNAVQTSRAILILNAICGNLDEKGGTLLPAAGMIVSENEIFNQVNKLPAEVLARRIGARALPLLSGPDGANVHPTFWARAVLTGEPYPVNALLTDGRNQLLGDQDARLTAAALKKIDFSVAMDLFLTPTAELADIVLPAASWLERDGFRGHFAYPYALPVQHRAVEPLYERRDDITFFIDLAQKMNLPIPWASVEAYNDFRLQKQGLSFRELAGINVLTQPKVYGRHRTGAFEFKTPSGKFEIYSTFLEKRGFDPLPCYLPPPETTTEFPLILIGGLKRVEYVHSAGRQIDKFRSREPAPRIELNPETAKARGISQGDEVKVESIYFGDERHVIFQADLVEGMHPGVAAVEHGWWFPEQEDPEHGCFAANVNAIIPNDLYDPLYGSTNLKSVPCRIARA
jgi:anaerobic selenocysteine-containing dehydrogenase